MQANSHMAKAILDLDLKGAFAYVTHQDILVNLNGLDCANRTCNNVRDFLEGLKAVIKMVDIASDPVDFGWRATSQGAVLSPLLFNTALISLTAKLGVIPDLRRGLYADDLPVCTEKGSVGEMHYCLQLAVDVVNE